MIPVFKLQNFVRILLFLCVSVSPSFASATTNSVKVAHLGDNKSMLNQYVKNDLLILPIQESANESRINVVFNNNVVKTIYVRLAVDSVDYYVPLDLSSYKDKWLSIAIPSVKDSAICWSKMHFADTFDTSNSEKFRPTFHFTPQYGWMNDPNGMFYKDGEYHLFYQYNPYASVWGNMNWGHAVSKDLVNWKHLPVAIEPDGLGSIFSGSCVVDKDNTAGFGKDAIIAFYTSAGDSQVQCMAYSTDNGKSFTKYTDNPILTSHVRDFRDPKVIWHNESKKWIMIVAVDQEMQIYSSSNLKDWSFQSAFGKGHGTHAGVWECPDLIQLPIEGTSDKKWLLICNINPGGPFGGSATQYFVGNFDGKTFQNDSPKATKFMDYGKDHYAAVTWSNAPQNRNIAIAWMNNWQYAGIVPTKQYSSANSVARELSLFKVDGEVYVKSEPVKELLALRAKPTSPKSFKVAGNHTIKNLLKVNDGAYEIEMTIENKNAKTITFSLYNSSGEKIDFIYDTANNKFSVDRTKSGIVDFSKDFPAVTTAPILEKGNITLRIFVDKSSVELFGNGGKFALTNIVYPATPYNNITFNAIGGSYSVKNFTVYPLKK